MEIRIEFITSKQDTDDPGLNRKQYRIMDDGQHRNTKNVDGWLQLSQSKILTDSEKKVFEELVAKLLDGLPNIAITNSDNRYKLKSSE